MGTDDRRDARNLGRYVTSREKKPQEEENTTRETEEVARLLTLAEFCGARHAMWLERTFDVPAEQYSRDVDPLRAHHYTNLWRELDRHTIYLFNEVQAKSVDLPRVVADTICFRAFNKIETHEAIVSHFGGWPEARQDWRALHEFLSKREANFTGAYVRCPDLKQVCVALGSLRHVATETAEALDRGATKLAWKTLRGVYSFGDFLVDQLMMDLIWQGGPFSGDFMPSLGPGATRGIEHCRESGQGDWDDVLQQVDTRLALETRPTVDNVPVAYDARALEHSLCEYFKYIKHQQAAGRKVKMRTYRRSGSAMDKLPHRWGAPTAIR